MKWSWKRTFIAHAQFDGVGCGGWGGGGYISKNSVQGLEPSMIIPDLSQMSVGSNLGFNMKIMDASARWGIYYK